MKKLILVDAFALFYRSFFAIRELSNSKGEPTNAIFGFLRKLDELQRTHDPSHLAVVFDAGLPARRMELLPEYKQQRPPMPDPLRAQIAPLKEYLEAADIYQITVDGQEADDVMASMAVWARDEAESVYLASSDKDLFQLIDDRVRLLPLKAGETMPMDAAAVVAKTGVRPDQIIDWLSLVGDNADNIGGVPGVGAKTAAKWLARFGDLTTLRRDVDQLPDGKVKLSLMESWQTLERNVELVRLDTALRGDWTWERLERRKARANRVLPFLEERFEFKGMAKDYREPELF